MTIDRSTAPDRYLFGPYEILATLGKGGMGVVYRAQDRTLAREVALKILRDDLRSEERVLARFRREAEAFARLDHPNIVHVYSVGAVENIPFIAMQYVEGETLADRLRRTGPMPWQDTLKIGLEVAEALICAHAAQVIHRDIKPGNILLAEDGRVLVTDFGIAKVLNATTQLTLDGSRLGTPQYMCPERCRNQPITPSSDLYSLGVVLFQSITGKLPYAARSNVELIDRITGEDALRASSLVPDLPESVDRLLAWLLEKNPTRRPADAAMLTVLINRVLEGKPLDAEADERERALDGYRRDLPGRAGRSAKQAPRKQDKATRNDRGSVAAKWWFGMPAWVRAGIAGGVGLLLAGCIVAALLPVLFRPSAHVSRLESAENLARWEAPAMLVDFTTERPGVRVGALNTPGLTIGQVLAGSQPGQLLLALQGPATNDLEATHATLILDAESGAARSLMPPWHGPEETKVLALSMGTNARDEEVLLFATGRDTRTLPTSATTEAGAGIPGTVSYVSSANAATLPYWRGESLELALAVSQGGFHEWRLTAHGYGARGESTLLTAAGSPIVAAAAATDGGWFAYLREPAAASRELWLSARNGEPRLLEEGKLSLTQRALEPGGGRLAYARLSTIPEVVVRETESDTTPVTWPGMAPQWFPSGGMVVCLADDALQHRQLFAVDPKSPLQPRQLTHLDSGVGESFAMDASGRWLLTPLPDATQMLLLDLSALIQN